MSWGLFFTHTHPSGDLIWPNDYTESTRQLSVDTCSTDFCHEFQTQISHSNFPYRCVIGICVRPGRPEQPLGGVSAVTHYRVSLGGPEGAGDGEGKGRRGRGGGRGVLRWPGDGALPFGRDPRRRSRTLLLLHQPLAGLGSPREGNFRALWLSSRAGKGQFSKENHSCKTLETNVPGSWRSHVLKG